MSSLESKLATAMGEDPAAVAAAGEDGDLQPTPDLEPESEPADPDVANVAPPSPGEEGDFADDDDPGVAGFFKDRFPDDPRVASLLEKYSDDPALLAGLYNAYTKIGERDQFSQIGQLLQRDPQEFQRQFGHLLPEQQQQQPVAPGDEPVTSFEMDWVQHLEMDANGIPVAFKQTAPAEMRQKFESYVQWKNDEKENVTIDKAVARLKEEMGPQINAAAQAANVPHQMAQQREYDVVMADNEGFVYDNAGWIFQNGTGQDNSPLTEAGQFFSNNVSALQQRGLDPRAARDVSVELTEKQFPAQPVQAAPRVQQPNNAPTPPGQAEPQPSGLSLEEKITRALLNDGQDVS